jgi:hybrid cluster-associated redox disulfide protein
MVTKNNKKSSSKEKKGVKISKKDKIGDILSICPQSALLMSKYGLHCVGCAIGVSETLEDGCKAHFLQDKDVDLLVKEINDEIVKDSKTKK